MDSEWVDIGNAEKAEAKMAELSLEDGGITPFCIAIKLLRHL